LKMKTRAILCLVLTSLSNIFLRLEFRSLPAGK
jgi:hypothetical protein